MKTILLIVLLVGIENDTSRVTKIFRKIDQKTAQISLEMTKSHTLEDIYRLQIKTDQALIQSHDLSRSLLLKTDSTRAILRKQSTDLQQTKGLLSLSLGNEKRLIDNSRRLEAEVKPGIDARNELNYINNFIADACLFMFWGFVIIGLIRVTMHLKWPHLMAMIK